ncbi:MAG TPA: hypothetical protein VN132_08510, partial [Bdellovibrio sp.]|nr:hypothetical protein [Bdellovibrio sp.]
DEKNHWLPPDNYQEDPEPKIAHRTSPTNIGLYLLSVISARDMGYLTSRAAVEVIEKVFLTIKGMAFHEGHLLNWYDTQTLEPLYPKYVSLVDSGNFAGYLLVVKQTAAHFLNEGELLDGSFKEGLRITLQIIEGEIKNLSKQKQTTISVSAHHLLSQLQECQKLVEMSSMNHLHEWFLSLKNLRGNLDDMRDSIAALEYDHGAHPYRRLKSWVDSVLEQVSQLQEDLDLYVPWSSGFLSPLHDIFRAQSDELHNQWTGLLRNLHGSLIFKKMPEAYEKAVVELQSLDANVQAKANLSTDNLKEFQQHLDDFKRSLTQSKNNIETLLEKVRRIRGLSEEVFQKMNFRFLLDKERNVFTIGYNVSEGRHDNAFYDLLASEAR